ncbi:MULTISPECIES: ATP-binding protein [unclassified Microcoleus]|uniref:ATP-binding protein n=1 Tax=unclassified Microcoleus TaxID=2642155 RepID=UPI0025FF14E2|nr:MULTISPECIES: ATP-binding protein [unclassified Microcoleus]
MNKKNRKIRCRINYKHTLLELSVNRKDPCEVIRELISNSYDAKASVIEIYPLLQYEGFIFIDNGIGISSEKEVNGVTPIDAFFSIGLSTKTPGKSIGYKCQGSKLCFASGKFALITRCKEDNESCWSSVIIDNPRDTLDSEQDNIDVQEDMEPWLTLKNLLPQPDARTVGILDHLDQKYFQSHLETGSLILVKNLEIDNFSNYYGTDQKYPYIKSYIRFYTRHGDVRILNNERTGFRAIDAKNFKTSSPTYNDKCQLFIWNCRESKLEEIASGYPYIDKQDFIIPGMEDYSWKSPTEIKRLNSGRFYYRSAHVFKFDGITYCLVLAIDGNRRALEYYEDLDRQGKKKSGIGFSSQRGTFICSEGLKICSYNEIFNHSLLQDYMVLSDGKAMTHYLLMINGTFQLVTDRNSLSGTSIKTLRNEQFLVHIKSFLDRAWNDSKVFKELIQRIGSEVSESKTEVQVKQFNKVKTQILQRDYFHILDREVLKGKKFFVPSVGEEHGVGALYTLLAHLIPANSCYSNFWLRPLNFSGQGIDSLAAEFNDDTLKQELKGLEYKYTFSSDELFNHPLVVTDQIVCWKLDESVQDGNPVDDGDYVGEISFTNDLKGIGCEIINIQNRYGSCHNSNIKVVCLKDLIDKTFQCQWKKGLSSVVSQSSKKRPR